MLELKELRKLKELRTHALFLYLKVIFEQAT